MLKKCNMQYMNEISQHDEIEYPVRINRYLFLKGYCSRRKADEMIKKGLVHINNKIAVLGQKVNKDDKVQLADEVKRMPQNYEYFLFHKPRGVVSHNPQRGEQSVEDFFPKQTRISPVGRLDKDSTGLMLLTNDGRIIDKMLNPKYDHQKHYVVKVDKPVTGTFLRKLEGGVHIEGYKTKPTVVEQKGDRSFSIILTEGKKHQIRRMCAALGYQVRDLKRVQIMNLRISGIIEGQNRALKMEEKVELLKSLGIMN